MPTQLTELRKPDRAAMASRLAAMVDKLPGCAATIMPEPTFLGPRVTVVNIIAPRGLRLSVDFDGKSSQPDTFVLSWHMDIDTTTKLRRDFASSVNTIHHHKATDVCEGFDALLPVIYARLTAAAEGWAFQDS